MSWKVVSLGHIPLLPNHGLERSLTSQGGEDGGVIGAGRGRTRYDVAILFQAVDGQHDGTRRGTRQEIQHDATHSRRLKLEAMRRRGCWRWAIPFWAE